MNSYSEDEILQGILNHDSGVLNHINDKIYPMIERMVIKSGGVRADAEDLFQDAIIIVIRRILSENFSLYCKFSTYFYSICWKQWNQELKSRAKFKKVMKIPDMVCEPEPELDGNYEVEKVINEILNIHMNQLSENCQKILRLHFNLASIEDIRLIMSYKNSHHVMDRKYRCKRSLYNRMLNDPKLKKVRDELIRENRTIY